ncbi:hypothetical protein V9K67_22660 [Paraflavisolibacter sp. H34]|uniref:hypothetical protein n=1 Tax=Huijunlia imazamoxiresistens TaxID=3127457 RepID=UPI003019D7B8
MTTLTTKIQYHPFETGEFTDERGRTLSDTIDLIRQFPWNDQRANSTVGLTGPSVTIEGKHGDYLRLSPYYHGKYVLHYFDAGKRLFLKSFHQLSEADPYLERFFAAPSFDPGDFRKENTWPRRLLPHFISRDFHYRVTPAVAWKYLWSTCGLILGLWLFMIFSFLNVGRDHYEWGILMVLAPYLFLVGTHLRLFWNYYRYAKDKLLIMSKGNEVFYFGTRDNPVRYHKSDIARATFCRIKHGKSSLAAFSLVELYLKDGTEFSLPNILIPDFELSAKLEGIARVTVHGYPLLRH